MPLKLIEPSTRSKVFRVRGTHRGIYVDRSTGATRKGPAEALRKKWEAEIERGEISGKPDLTFALAVASWIQAGGEDRFIPKILRYFGLKIAAKDIDQAAVDRAAVELYPNGKPATRARQVYAPISAILRHAGLALDIRRPKGAAGTRRTRWLSADEFERVALAAKAIDPELAVMMVVMVYTGMRLGEALALRCADIDLERGEAILHRTKNGDPRLVHLPPRLVAALANHPRALDRGGRLFRFTRNGALNDMARKAYVAAGVDPGDAPFHVLRHTWATWMVRAGADLVSTGAWRSPTSARGYTHFVLSDEAKKADALPGASLEIRAPLVRL